MFLSINMSNIYLHIYLSLALIFFIAGVIANPRKNELNNSKKSVEPTVFWPILRSRHNITDPQYR